MSNNRRKREDKMRSKLLTLFAAGLLLAACESTSDGSGGGSGSSSGSTGGSGSAGTSSGAAGSYNQGSKEQFIVEVGDRVYFDFDASNLRADARAQLEKQAAWLRQFPSVSATIEGHCDERGTREYNLALGERRANSARDYLVALGISGGRLATISFGKERPAVIGTGEAVWALNRRAVTRIDE